MTRTRGSYRIIVIGLLAGMVAVLGVTPARAASFITVSGHVSAPGAASLAGVEVGLTSCVRDGITSGGYGTTDEAGYYEVQVLASCTGAEFSLNARNLVDAKTGLAMGLYLQKWGVTGPAQDTTLDLEIPDQLVALNVNATYSDNTPVTRGRLSIQNQDQYSWPQVSLPLFGGQTVTGWWYAKTSSCDYSTPTTCRFLVPKNSTTNVVAEAFLPANVVFQASQLLTVGTAETTQTIKLQEKPLTFITVSGHVSAPGATSLAGVEVGLTSCVRDGITSGGYGTTDEAGYYEVQVLASCTGAEFSLNARNLVDAKTGLAMGLYLQKWGVTGPAQDTTLDLEIPDQLVALNVNATYSDNTPVTRGRLSIQNQDQYSWPQVSLPLFGGQTVTGWWYAKTSSCDYSTPTTCRFLVPKNSTTNVVAEAFLPANVVFQASQLLTVGTAETTQTIKLQEKPLTFITVSGHVSAPGATSLAGVEVGLTSCVRDGITSGGYGTTDEAGYYEVQVLASCTGAEFSLNARNLVDAKTGLAMGLYLQKWGVTGPAQDTTLDLEIPDQLVALNVNATYSDNTPVTRGRLSIQNQDQYSWPQVSLPLFGGQTVTGWWYAKTSSCDYSTPTTCRFLVPKNSTTNVVAEAFLPANITTSMSAEITAGDTEAGHTFVLRNLAEVGSQGAIAGVIGIVAPAGTTVSKATTSSTDANPLTDGMSDLTGAVDYTISGLTPGGSIRMTFALPDGATPTNVYKLIGDTYVDVTAAATFNGQLVTLKITDGALGDTDGVVNGVIVDPVVVVHSRLKAQGTLSVRSVANTPFNIPVRLSTSGGSGTGRVSYVAMNGSATGCTVVDGVLTALKAGTCKVVASKAGDGSYRLASSASRTVTFTAGRLDTPTPTVSPARPVVDADLTATAGSWAPEPVSLGYQWYRKAKSGKVTKITGATSAVYHVKPSDLGYRIRAKVTGTKTGYTSTTRYSAYTSPVGRAPFTTAPTPMISGVARAQMTLAVTTTGWEPTSTSVKIRWQRNLAGVWKDITGATSTSYNPTASDIGRALRARVIAYRSGYTTTTSYSNPTDPVTPGIAPTIPTLTEPTPTVDGQIGVTPGIWSPEPDQFSYQWYAKSPAGKTTQIPDATAQTYLVEGRWAGYKLRARVTSHLTDYADDSRYTAWSTTIAKAAFTNTPAPVIDGTPEIGQQVTALPGDWQPTPTKLSYTWYRASNTTWTAITQTTTSPTYTLTTADLGKQIRVKVTAERTGYTTLITYSQPVTPTT